jgi:acyl-coenzyme A thioesterase PaaI-like protein
VNGAFQDLIPGNHCWGCGRDNPDGLGIRSRWDEPGATSVCHWSPSPIHAAGPTTVLNGGIIATLLDCHGVCTAIAARYLREERSIGSDPHVWCVTASLRIDYLAPTAIDLPIEVRAVITSTEGRRTHLTCALWSGDRERARGDLLAVQVPDAWLVEGPPL